MVVMGVYIGISVQYNYASAILNQNSWTSYCLVIYQISIGPKRNRITQRYDIFEKKDVLRYSHCLFSEKSSKLSESDESVSDFTISLLGYFTVSRLRLREYVS